MAVAGVVALEALEEALLAAATEGTVAATTTAAGAVGTAAEGAALTGTAAADVLGTTGGAAATEGGIELAGQAGSEAVLSDGLHTAGAVEQAGTVGQETSLEGTGLSESEGGVSRTLPPEGEGRLPTTSSAPTRDDGLGELAEGSAFNRAVQQPGFQGQLSAIEGRFNNNLRTESFELQPTNTTTTAAAPSTTATATTAPTATSQPGVTQSIAGNIRQAFGKVGSVIQQQAPILGITGLTSGEASSARTQAQRRAESSRVLRSQTRAGGAQTTTARSAALTQAQRDVNARRANLERHFLSNDFDQRVSHV